MASQLSSTGHSGWDDEERTVHSSSERRTSGAHRRKNDERMVIKVKMGSDIRVVPLQNEELNYDELILMMERIYRGKLTSKDSVIVKYRDAEKDLVTVADDADLTFALSRSPNRQLSIELFVNRDPDTNAESLGTTDVMHTLRALRDELTSMLEKAMRHQATAKMDQHTSAEEHQLERPAKETKAEKRAATPSASFGGHAEQKPAAAPTATIPSTFAHENGFDDLGISAAKDSLEDGLTHSDNSDLGSLTKRDFMLQQQQHQATQPQTQDTHSQNQYAAAQHQPHTQHQSHLAQHQQPPQQQQQYPQQIADHWHMQQMQQSQQPPQAPPTQAPHMGHPVAAAQMALGGHPKASYSFPQPTATAPPSAAAMPGMRPPQPSLQQQQQQLQQQLQQQQQQQMMQQQQQPQQSSRGATPQLPVGLPPTQLMGGMMAGAGANPFARPPQMPGMASQQQQFQPQPMASMYAPPPQQANQAMYQNPAAAYPHPPPFGAPPK